MSRFVRHLLAAALLLLAVPFAGAQSLPTQTNVSGNVATIVIGGLTDPVADVTLTFESASGLTPANLGVRADIVSLADPGLLARLPNSLTSLDSAFPVMLTVEPPAGGLSFRRIVKVEIHTHALTYTYGTSYRLFKAPLGGAFRDISTQIAQGSVRARGTTDGFSQFLILADVRRSGDVANEKLERLRTSIAALPSSEAGAFEAHRSAAAQAVADRRYDDAIKHLDAIAERARARAGTHLAEVWTAGGGSVNSAGQLIAGAATAKFSVAYLRNFGH